MTRKSPTRWRMWLALALIAVVGVGFVVMQVYLLGRIDTLKRLIEKKSRHVLLMPEHTQWPPTRTKTVLVVGAAGMVGTHLSLSLLEDKHVVVGVDHLQNTYPYYHVQATRKRTDLEMIIKRRRLEMLWQTGMKVHARSACDADFIKQLLNVHNFTHVVYAATPSDDEIDVSPVLHASNAGCLVTLLATISSSHQRPHVILASSHLVYPSSAHVHMEDESIDACSKDGLCGSVLGNMHALNEMTMQAFHRTHGLPYTVLRLFDVYGPECSAKHVLVRMLQQEANITLAQKTDFIHIFDVTQLIRRAMDYGAHELVVNIGSGSGVDAHEVRAAVAQVLSAVTSCPIEPICHIGNVRAATKILGYTPKVCFSSGFKGLSDWHAELLQQIRQKQSIVSVTTSAIQHEIDVVFSSYFTSEKDPQRNARRSSNRYAYVQVWYDSIVRLGLNAVVFHDGLNDDFVKALQTDKIAFKHVTLNKRSTNDARFYAYANYLRDHPEIGRVFVTDISDVAIQRNPFEIMDVLGDLVYVGTDVNMFPSMESMEWLVRRASQCFPNSTNDMSLIVSLPSVYNAGVIGASRGTMLEFLLKVTQILNVTPHQVNCNMVAVNKALHLYFDMRIFTGFPLNSLFYAHQNAPKGVYFVHK